MKKKIITTIAILFIINTYSQNMIIDYNYNFNSNSFKNQLVINNNISLWKYNNKDQKTIDENLSDIFIFKDYTLDFLYQNEELFNAKFIVKDSLSKFSWKLESETKEILGYKCNLATTIFRGRKYSAFYTSKIIISDGPWKFYGLPGLILSISSDDSIIQYEANKIEFNSNETIDSKKIIDNEFISWEDFRLKFIETFDNYIKKIKASGVVDDGAEVNIKIVSPEIIYPKVQGGDGVKF